MEQEAASENGGLNPLGRVLGKVTNRTCLPLRRPCGERVDAGKLVNTVAKCYCFGYSTAIIMPLIIENCNNNMFIFCSYGNIGIIKS